MHISLQTTMAPEVPEWLRSSVETLSTPKIVLRETAFQSPAHRCTPPHQGNPRHASSSWKLGILGSRCAHRLGLTMLNKAVLKLSSMRGCNLQRSKQKVNWIVHITETSPLLSSSQQGSASDLDFFSSFPYPPLSIHPFSMDYWQRYSIYL